jgi:D-lyxose ketol-isomerase
MKRSEINIVVKEAQEIFQQHGWALPPNPRWDVTDFGLGDFNSVGLTLVNLAEQPEYCEKLMYVRHMQVTPRHYHAAKKEDIICRWGRLAIELPSSSPVRLQVNGEWRDIPSGKHLMLSSGERVTLTRGVLHSFWADSEHAVLGEVSTANDDAHDNYFEDKRVGRFSEIDEDESPIVKLVTD